MRSSEIKMTIFDECVSVYLCVHACVRVYASVKHKSRFIVWHRENLLCYCIICVCEYLVWNVREENDGFASERKSLSVGWWHVSRFYLFIILLHSQAEVSALLFNAHTYACQ